MPSINRYCSNTFFDKDNGLKYENGLESDTFNLVQIAIRDHLIYLLSQLTDIQNLFPSLLLRRNSSSQILSRDYRRSLIRLRENYQIGISPHVIRSLGEEIPV